MFSFYITHASTYSVDITLYHLSLELTTASSLINHSHHYISLPSGFYPIIPLKLQFPCKSSGPFFVLFLLALSVLFNIVNHSHFETLSSHFLTSCTLSSPISLAILSWVLFSGFSSSAQPINIKVPWVLSQVSFSSLSTLL